MQPASSLFSTANFICFPDYSHQKTPCSVQLVPKEYSTPFSCHCAVYSFLQGALAACGTSCSSVGASPGQAQAFPGMEQSLPQGGSTRGTEEHMHKQLPPVILRHNMHCNFWNKPKRNGPMHPLPRLLTTLPAKNLQNPCIFM